MKIGLIIPTLMLAGLSSAIASSDAPTIHSTQQNTYNVEARQAYMIEVDKKGVMRRSDTGEEVSYYGTNLTTPFAHAYRALGYLGVDHKQAIDRDVYHIARLGLNAFRLHLWDVEIADSAGNLVCNEHLDLLDYMLAQLRRRGIDIVLTAQTNFGNGYPEKNIDTGAFTYDYEKCNIHEDINAQKIQENYLRQLAVHVNPYTGLSYAADKAIIAMEINNEPCHSGTKKEVTAYINRMAKALRSKGWDKPIFYNVSHNPDVRSAYYDAKIDGTTYQWYPIGLVAGHERKGNFLPYVDNYNITWKDFPTYNSMARIVYEFDPADILYSYMYPAIVRTFRKEGFQWITQFAYDPIDMARFNTEYQTHFLNLAYTPSKAISMMIAAEAARQIPRGTDYGTYPQNTHFGSFIVDGIADVSIINDTLHYYHTRSTNAMPADITMLEHIAGTGSSPLATYNGTGAYFLDKLDDNTWRLEIMPDVILTEDPFEKTSLNREIGQIVYNRHQIKLAIHGLGNEYIFTALNPGNDISGKASDGSFEAYPGVYLLSTSADATEKWSASTPFGTETVSTPHGNMTLGEYVAPAASAASLPRIKHIAAVATAKGLPLHIEADATAGAGKIDSLVVYPSDISFWQDNNTVYPMKKVEGKPYTWSVDLPVSEREDKVKYNIVAFSGDNVVTFPDATIGTPLSWDAPDDRQMYVTDIIAPETPLMLLSLRQHDANTEAGTLPDGLRAWLREDLQSPLGVDTELFTFNPESDTDVAIIRSYVEPILSNKAITAGKSHIVAQIPDAEGYSTIEIGFIASDGVTWLAPINLKNGVGEVSLSELQKRVTELLPVAFPTFLDRIYDGTATAKSFDINNMQYVVVRITPEGAGSAPKIPIEAIYLR